ncbi:MAG: type II toxin-antitoxin system RelE/ParE family toxin [Planctomycetes bacterium]|nr:type II toxin-antitoxin system RelE/ParE family toxin [Planctomycetota bacterium]
MIYSVHVLAEAEEDLLEIASYVATHDSLERALSLLARLEKACASLATFPNRGHVPPELMRVGVTGYREIHFKPYRIIYRVEEAVVHVYAVLDGRRDLDEILQRRLLR